MQLDYLDLLTAGMFLVLSLGVFLVAQGVVFSPRRELLIPDDDEEPGNGTPPQDETAASNEAIASAQRADLDAWTESIAAQIPQAQVEVAGLEQDLRRAGYYRPGARKRFLAVRNGLTIGVALAAGALAVLAGPSHAALARWTFVGGALGAALAFVLPRFYVHWRGKRRAGRIQNALPDALDMVAMCVTGGLAVRDALRHVSREIRFSHPDLAWELEIIRHQAEVGTMELALRQFAGRIDAVEVKSLVAMLTQSERLGTNVATALRDYADGVRRSYRQRAEERANKTGVKILFPLVLCLVPSVFILLWGPSLLELRDFLVTQDLPGQILAQPDFSELTTMPNQP